MHHHFFQILLPDCLVIFFKVTLCNSSPLSFSFKAFIYGCFEESGKGDDKEDVAGLKVYLQHVNSI